MDILGLFILRHSEPTSPELLEAWDEYSIDANPEGWAQAKSAALLAVGETEIMSSGVITLRVSETDLLDRLAPTGTVNAQVLGKEPDEVA